MSEVKHTPWSSITEKYCDSASVVDSSGAELANIGYILTKFDSPETSREIEKEETDAIARLFAAAPDLLEALRNLLARDLGLLPIPYGHDCAWCGACCDRAESDAREAIAKAEGRA